MREYYDRRASEYDDWYFGLSLDSGLDRPGWSEELQALGQAIPALSPGRVVDSALREDVEAECVRERLLTDGSTCDVYKRSSTPESLLEELGDSRTLHSGRWFLAAQA